MKKNLLTVFIQALLIVNIVLTTIMMVSVIGVNKKTSGLVNSVASALNLELSAPGEAEEEKEPVSLADTEVYSLADSMMIPLASADGKTVYMIFEMSLSMNTKGDGYKDLGENIAAGTYDSIIGDMVNSIVSAHSEAECRDNFNAIRDEILQAVQDKFGTFIYAINISGIKFG